MRIFVTGATGFIGRHLMPLLQEHNVLYLTRSPKRITTWPFATSLVGSLQDQKSWRRGLEEFEAQCCIHLAWEGLPDYSLEFCRMNLDASLRLIDCLAQMAMPRMVVAGSCWEYGAASGSVSEAQQPTGLGVFGATKNALREILESAATERKLDYRWARIFFAYGPGQRQTSLIPQCRAAFLAGKAPQIRSPTTTNDFVHVDDIARGILALALANVNPGVYNLGSGRPTAVGEIVNIVAAHYGAEPPYQDLRPGAGFWSNIAKTLSAAGWGAQTPLADGVAATLRALERPGE